MADQTKRLTPHQKVQLLKQICRRERMKMPGACASLGWDYVATFKEIRAAGYVLVTDFVKAAPEETDHAADK